MVNCRFGKRGGPPSRSSMIPQLHDFQMDDSGNYPEAVLPIPMHIRAPSYPPRIWPLNVCLHIYRVVRRIMNYHCVDQNFLSCDQGVSLSGTRLSLSPTKMTILLLHWLAWGTSLRARFWASQTTHPIIFVGERERAVLDRLTPWLWHCLIYLTWGAAWK